MHGLSSSMVNCIWSIKIQFKCATCNLHQDFCEPSAGNVPGSQVRVKKNLKLQRWREVSLGQVSRNSAPHSFSKQWRKKEGCKKIEARFSGSGNLISRSDQIILSVGGAVAESSKSLLLKENIIGNEKVTPWWRIRKTFCNCCWCWLNLFKKVTNFLYVSYNTSSFLSRT